MVEARRPDMPVVTARWRTVGIAIPAFVPATIVAAIFVSAALVSAAALVTAATMLPVAVRIAMTVGLSQQHTAVGCASMRRHGQRTSGQHHTGKKHRTKPISIPDLKNHHELQQVNYPPKCIRRSTFSRG